MQISSSAFENGEKIPQIFTCDGQDISPHLLISDVPSEALSLALIMDDPDAPRGIWTHWIMWNIPPQTIDIPEGDFVEDTVEGINSSGSQGYSGPCPQDKTHRYFFNLYALDTVLDLGADADLEELTAEMQGHIITEAKFFGTYGR